MLLITLNGRHPSLAFTMELPKDNKISFIGIEMVKNRTKIETQAYRKSTNTGLHLHHSHSDNRYKDSLLKTMIHQAYALASTKEAFNAKRALTILWALLIQQSTNASANRAERNTDDSSTVRISLPKIKRPLMRSGSSYAILTIRLALYCSQFS